LGCISQKDRRVTIQGSIAQLHGTELYVTYTNARFELTVDTIQSSTSGKFHLRIRTCDELAPVTIYFARQKCWTTLFAEPGDRISIRGSIQYVDLLTIRGGAVNNDLNRFKSRIRTLYQERLDLLRGVYSRDNATEVRLAEINLQLNRAAKEFIKENPTSIASVVLIQDFFYQEYDPSTSELLGLLKGKASNSKMANKIREGLHSGR
jgi:hypothetical protein